MEWAGLKGNAFAPRPVAAAAVAMIRTLRGSTQTYAFHYHHSQNACRLVACRGEALPRPLATCEVVAIGRRSASPLQTTPRTDFRRQNEGKTLMRTIAAAVCALFVLSAHSSAQTLDELKRDGNGGPTDNILTYGMGYHQHRYSPLKEINKQTIKRLVPVWSLSLDNNWGEQAQPVVYDGVMYVTNARATVAIDVGTGKQVWKQTLDWPPETPRVVCCGVSNKGAAIFDGKVFRTTLDAHV